MRSFATVVGMYWTKAGIKEVSIATTLAIAAFYTSKESVDVLAEFSNWGRDFYDFYVNAGNASSGFKAGLVDALKSAYEMDAYAPTMDLLKAIVQDAPHNLGKIDLTSALSGLKVNPAHISAFTEQIQSQYGSLSLAPFAEAENFSKLAETMTSIGIAEAQQKDMLNAIQIGVDVKGSAADVIGRVQEQFASVDFDAMSDPEKSKAVLADFDYLTAENVLDSAGVKSNISHLLTTVPKDFSLLLGKFLAFILPSIYTAEHLALRWQTWTTGKISNEWNKYKGAYHVKFNHTNIDNPDQRIEQNIAGITSFVVDTSTDGMQNALKLYTFVPMLAAMGSFNPSLIGGPDIEINNFLAWSAFGYAAIGTGILGAIAWNLPKIRRRFQETSANFRAPLISIHNQAEQIALTDGGDAEKKILKEKFDDVIDVNIQNINKNMQMRTFNSIHGNVGSYVPFLLAAPQYFAGIISFGQVSQAMGIFRTVEGSFEFVKNIIPAFAGFKAGIDRTAQLIDALELVKYEELERRYYTALEDNPELVKQIRANDKRNDGDHGDVVNLDMDMD